MNRPNYKYLNWTNISFNKDTCSIYYAVLFFIKIKINLFIKFFKIFIDWFTFFKNTTVSIFKASNYRKFNIFFFFFSIISLSNVFFILFFDYTINIIHRFKYSVIVPVRITSPIQVFSFC